MKIILIRIAQGLIGIAGIYALSFWFAFMAEMYNNISTFYNVLTGWWIIPTIFVGISIILFLTLLIIKGLEVMIKLNQKNKKTAIQFNVLKKAQN